MMSKTRRFIKDRFSEYYADESYRIKAPPSIDKREFGFLLFTGGVMVRHKSFINVESLRSFIKSNVPLHVYYSTAYYDFPEEEMSRKGWIGADLYFDIDADHIPTRCGKIHDRWICRGCGFSGKGITPDKCPICNSVSFEEKTWPCDVCLEDAKKETIKLIEILMDDFGFSKDEIKVSFSGHRGYHVYVEHKDVQSLDSMARKEIVDYVTCSGFDVNLQGLSVIGRGGGGGVIGPGLEDPGWRGRLARGLRSILNESTREDLRRLGVKDRVVDLLVANREALSKSWSSTGPWGLIKGVGVKSWRHIMNCCLKVLSVKVDTVVTTDIHRLIRLDNTLHGKTGMLKVSLSTSSVESFNPFKEAVAFKKGEVIVMVDEAPQFMIGDETFGPYRRERVELPMAAALLLLCKGLAEVAD